MRQILLVAASLLIWSGAFAQIPVEVFVGHKKTTLDVMFFKYFKNKDNTNSKFLFFNRNRVSVDYKMTATTDLPSYSFTETVSYNNSKLKGFAPVLVGQLSNRGVYPKAGIQFVFMKKDFLFFTWAVCETKAKPIMDFFLLMRYEPTITEKVKAFAQVELINAFPLESTLNYTFIQRARLGLKIKSWQFGAGTDFAEIGNSYFATTTNLGGFLRHEF